MVRYAYSVLVLYLPEYSNIHDVDKEKELTA